MRELISAWIMRLCAVAVLSACAMAITPDGRVKKTVRAVCGIATMLSLLSPFVSEELPDIGEVFSAFREEAIAVSADMAAVNDDITVEIIKSETEAYISDVGRKLKVPYLSAAVTVRKREDGNYYPYAADIVTDADEGQKNQLGEMLVSELGIAEERITWSEKSDG